MIKKLKQLPILRWLFNTIVLSFLCLMMKYFSSRNEELYTLLFVMTSFFFFYICMRPAILCPKRYKLVWIFFVLVLGVFLWNCWWDIIKCLAEHDLFTIRKVFLWLIVVFPFFISVFMDIKASNDTKDVFPKRVRSIFFMLHSSVAYAIPFYFYGIHGVEFSPIVPLFLAPVYVLLLFIGLYVGWGKKGCMFGLLLVPLIVSSLIGILFMLP